MNLQALTGKPKRAKDSFLLRARASPPGTALLVVVVVVIVCVDGPQEVAEDPLRYVPPLLPRLHIVKTEVDALKDTRVHDILAAEQIRNGFDESSRGEYISV